MLEFAAIFTPCAVDFFLIKAAHAHNEGGNLDEIHDDTDPGADEEVVNNRDGHVESLVETETGQILLTHVDGGEDAAHDHENAADAIVASDKD